MAMYSFSLESLTAVAGRSKDGRDDLWLIVTVTLGTRTSVTSWPIGIGVQAGQGFTGPWTAGPYQVAVGDTFIATHTLVNLSGSSAQDQDQIIASLGADIADAATRAAAAASSVEVAVRGLFGGSGELLTAPAVPAGVTDCRGLVGLFIASSTNQSTPSADVVDTTQPLTLNGTAPATCGTTPQSTAVFSMQRSPNVFSQSTPITALVSTPATVETFAAGMDGQVRYNVRFGSNSFGAWQVLGKRTFSQSAPLVALNGPQRRDVFATGTDGVIYTLRWTAASGWVGWLAVSEPGQFLPDTPVSAIWVNGVLSLFAVDPDGTAQSISWSADAIVNPWAPLPGLQFARRTPLTVMSWVDPWIEVYGVSSGGFDFHTSRATSVPAWGPWQAVGGMISSGMSIRYFGLTFDVLVGGVKKTMGMTTFRVDDKGFVNELGWTGQTSWFQRKVLSGLKTFYAGSVSGLKIGNEFRLYLVDVQTRRVGQSTWTMQMPNSASDTNATWSPLQLLAVGPSLASDALVAPVTADDSHVELFVIDRDGIAQHLAWAASTGWGAWSAV